MSTTEHTLDDLVHATGFSKRQIRFSMGAPGSIAARAIDQTLQ